MKDQVVLPLSQALDYSVGRYLTALERSRGRKHDAIHNANWSDVAISLRSSVERLPARGRKAMFANKVGWHEASPKSDIACAQASAAAIVQVMQRHWEEHHIASEACDRVKGALEDAHVSVADLTAAMFAR